MIVQVCSNGFTFLFYFFLLFLCYCAGVQQGFHLPLLLLPDALSFAIVQVYSKGFTFLFYFFLLLALCCALDLVTWGCRLVIPGLRDVSVTRYLAVVEPGVDPQRSSVTPRFLQSLGVDGRLLLAVTADHCGPLAAADLTNHLWLVFKDTPRPGHAPSAALGSSLSPHSPAPSVPPQATNSGGAYSGDPAAIPLVAMGGQK